VLKFTVKISAGTVEFLDWWEKNKGKLSIVVPEALNAVRVMTIHKAKGLEFPLVILPFARESLKNTKTYLWVDLDKHVASGLGTAILRSDKALESTDYSFMYTEERQKSMLDLVNLLYVSMTRPVERLYILTKSPPEKQAEINSLPGFFQLFLQAEQVWVDGQTLYTFGTRQNHEDTRPKPETGTVTHQDVISNDWRQKIRIRTRAPQMWDMENPARKTQWGNRIHTLLSSLATGKDIDHVIKKAVLTGLLSNDEVDKVRALLMSVISDPELARLFSDEVSVKTEAEILLPEGSFYRPDRVVFDNEKVTVMDYKTGVQSEKHGEQLKRYAGYISEMGYTNIHRVLVYLEPDVRVVAV
jgi:ATP-dependent exoDNAse (exonuclease V) beta subunit